VTFDYKGTVIFANAPAVVLIGGSPKTVREMNREVRKVYRNGGQRYFKEGSRVIKATAVRIDSPLREATHVHLLLEDSTREYQLLHDLSQRESLASLGEAAATLAHEIRNPLTTIRAVVDTLTPNGAADSKQIELLRGETRRLGELVEKSLELARPIVPDRQDCDVNRILQKIARRAPESVRIHLDLADDLPSLHGDPDLLGRVFVNLLQNAVEAGASDIFFTTAADGDVLSVRVHNHGPPISPEILGRLFQPFVTTKAKGTGVGLAYCRKVVVAHGGEVAARNLDDGPELEVRLPWTS
jgi:two-component system sensor histidine kinase AtoS